MRHCNRKTSAFTLIELILVMVILAFVVATIAPLLRGFAVGRRAADNAANLVSLAEYARGQAIAEARTYRLNFNEQDNSYWLTVDNNDGAFQPPLNDFGRQFKATEGISVRCDAKAQPDGQYIQFRSNGRSDPARVVVSDRLGKSLVVACPSATETFQVLSPEDAAR